MLERLPPLCSNSCRMLQSVDTKCSLDLIFIDFLLTFLSSGSFSSKRIKKLEYALKYISSIVNALIQKFLKFQSLTFKSDFQKDSQGRFFLPATKKTQKISVFILNFPWYKRVRLTRFILFTKLLIHSDGTYSFCALKSALIYVRKEKRHI